MPDTGRPNVFTIPVHRNFADALVEQMLRENKGDDAGDRLALARQVIIVPNNRAGQSLRDGFVRRADKGVLMPRIVAIGDVGEDAVTAPLFDPLNAEPLPPAIDPLTRQFLLARLIQEERALVHKRVDAAEAMRLARDMATTIDQLAIEEVPLSRLRDLDLGELAVHWQRSLEVLAVVIDRWPAVLQSMGLMDGVERRNILIRRTAAHWRTHPPKHGVTVAGVTAGGGAIADLLRTVARLPQGRVVFEGIDLDAPDDEWAAIGGDDTAGGDGKGPGIESHPQFHLRHLLDQMLVARSDVQLWPGRTNQRGAERDRVVSTAFKPAQFTETWQGLSNAERRLSGVRLARFATPADEAQGIAIALRSALEQPGKTAALITPDRALAQRVSAHLRRWGVTADDSAGRPLSETPAGALLLGLARLLDERFAPAALLSVLKHPLVRAGEERLAWLDGARAIDLALRGPRPAPGLAGITAFLAGGDARTRVIRAAAMAHWQGMAPLLAPLDEAANEASLPLLIDCLRGVFDSLCGVAGWGGPGGRAAAQLFEQLAVAAPHGPLDVRPGSLWPLLRDLMSGIAVRPPQGGHPRLSIWGLLEARLQSADLLVLGGLNEGVWPAAVTVDPWLAPRIRADLGLGTLERRIGLAAHDLASALGGTEVLLTRAMRDTRAPTIASRFLLRLEAMTGGLNEASELVELAQAIDRPGKSVPRATRPAPAPPAALRPKRIAVTAIDQLKADPYAFYARTMLDLSPLDAVDADPGPAWRGTAVHAVLDAWHKSGSTDPAALHAGAAQLLADPAIHPMVRAFWAPRLTEAIDWIIASLMEDRANGRTVLATECRGEVMHHGVTLFGRADRIDRMDDGTLAIVDYKTGKAPSDKAVVHGFAMQLGLLGLIAEQGGFADITGTPGTFEYWSLAKDGVAGFGKRHAPTKGLKLTADEFLDIARDQLAEVAARWLNGDEAFIAKLVPEYAPYDDYDQLMRRDEWHGAQR